jgi:hypothetical protein
MQKLKKRKFAWPVVKVLKEIGFEGMGWIAAAVGTVIHLQVT